MHTFCFFATSLAAESTSGTASAAARFLGSWCAAGAGETVPASASFFLVYKRVHKSPTCAIAVDAVRRAASAVREQISSTLTTQQSASTKNSRSRVACELGSFHACTTKMARKLFTQFAPAWALQLLPLCSDLIELSPSLLRLAVTLQNCALGTCMLELPMRPRKTALGLTQSA